MKKKQRTLIVVIVSILFLILLFKFSDYQKPLSVVSIGGSCSRVWMSTIGSNYYLRCNVNYNSWTHCENPLIVEYKDDNPDFVSISNWVFNSGGETCNITESHDTYVKFECQMPEQYKGYCGITPFSASGRIDLLGSLNYNSCYGYRNYIPTGGMKCGGIVSSSTKGQYYTKILECIGKDTYTTIQTCGNNQVCLNKTCIDTECYINSDCIDTCSMDFNCKSYKCIGTPKNISSKPCNQAIWTESTCSWNTSDCVPEPPQPTPISIQQIIQNLIDFLKQIFGLS